MAATKQPGLNLRFDEQHSWSSLFVSDANSDVVRQLQQYPWDSDDVLWILSGPDGCGKTVLANLWAHTWQAWLGQKRSWLDLLSVLPLQGACFVVDDFSFELNTDEEEKLWHLYTLLQHLNGRLLITTKHPPGRWPDINLPDLQTRLMASKQLMLKPPSDEHLTALLARQMRTYGFGHQDKDRERYTPIWNYCLLRTQRSYAAITELARVMHEEALTRHSDLTIPVARRALLRLLNDEKDNKQEDLLI